MSSERFCDLVFGIEILPDNLKFDSAVQHIIRNKEDHNIRNKEDLLTFLNDMQLFINIEKSDEGNPEISCYRGLHEQVSLDRVDEGDMEDLLYCYHDTAVGSDEEDDDEMMNGMILRQWDSEKNEE
jgi:hypothetical protein